MGGLSACGGWSCGPRPWLSEESTLPQEEYGNADGCCLDANVVLVRTWLSMLGQDDDPAKSHQHDHCPLRPAHHRCPLSDSDWPSNEGSSSCWLTYRYASARRLMASATRFIASAYAFVSCASTGIAR